MRIINMIKTYLLIAVIIVCSEGVLAQSTLNDIEISLSNSYDSNYISEGRCNLASGGLSSFNSDISFHWLDMNM